MSDEPKGPHYDHYKELAAAVTRLFRERGWGDRYSYLLMVIDTDAVLEAALKLGSMDDVPHVVQPAVITNMDQTLALLALRGLLMQLEHDKIHVELAGDDA